MTNSKDPFDIGDEEERTRIQKPMPGGRAGSPPSAAAPAPDTERTVILGGAASGGQPRPQPAEAAAARAQPVQGKGHTNTDASNPLIAAGARLLALAGHLRAAASHNDVPGLRRQCVQELAQYESQARARGADERDVQLGHYILCALLDDVVMATPWGSRQGWSERSLTSAFHNQVDSGDKLYELAARLERTPAQHPNVLEFTYVALSLGFEGRLRIDPRGPAQHQKVRENLFRVLREMRGEGGRALSGAWQGVAAAHRPLVRQIPIWVYFSAFGVAGLIVFSIFLFMLNRQTQAALAPLEGVAFAVAEAPRQAFVQPPAPDDAFDRVKGILQPDIDAGRVIVQSDPSRIRVRIVNLAGSELFPSGQDAVSSAYRPLIARIAEASKITGGPVYVNGHSDAQPIATRRFRSNFELSLARAEAVKRLLVEESGEGSRFSSEGFGPDQPVADNGTAEGRRENRRVEIILQKSASGQ